MSRPLPVNALNSAYSPPPRSRVERNTKARLVAKSTHVKLKAPGELLVSSVVGVHDEGAPGARARVTADVIF